MISFRRWEEDVSNFECCVLFAHNSPPAAISVRVSQIRKQGPCRAEKDVKQTEKPVVVEMSLLSQENMS